MSVKNYLKRFGKLLAARDQGWTCHDCKTRLIPVGISFNDSDYSDSVEDGDFFGEPTINWFPKSGYEYASVDHVIPRSRGGTDDLTNLVLACIICNSERRTMPYETFKQHVRAKAVTA